MEKEKKQIKDERDMFKKKLLDSIKNNNDLSRSPSKKAMDSEAERESSDE